MEFNDIKKALYKENPTAKMLFVRDEVVHYETTLNNGTKLEFKVPMEETKGVDFLCEMDSKHLIRWYSN